MGPSVDAVLLDAGNTLVFVDPRRTLEVIARHGGDADPERFRASERAARIRLSSALGAGVTGQEDQFWRDYFTALFEGSGVAPERWPEVGRALRELHARDHLWTHVPEGTAEALERILDAGYRLGVISNADGRVPGLLERMGLSAYFEFILDSELVGVEKPDRRIFDMAVERLELAAGRCLYVGDLYAIDVLGARSAGLQALLLDPFESLPYEVDRIRGVTELPAYLEGTGSAS